MIQLPRKGTRYTHEDGEGSVFELLEDARVDGQAGHWIANLRETRKDGSVVMHRAFPFMRRFITLIEPAPPPMPEMYGTMPSELPETLPDGTIWKWSAGYRIYGAELDRPRHYKVKRIEKLSGGDDSGGGMIQAREIDWTTVPKPAPPPGKTSAGSNGKVPVFGSPKCDDCGGTDTHGGDPADNRNLPHANEGFGGGVSETGVTNGGWAAAHGGAAGAPLNGITPQTAGGVSMFGGGGGGAGGGINSGNTPGTSTDGGASGTTTGLIEGGGGAAGAGSAGANGTAGANGADVKGGAGGGVRTTREATGNVVVSGYFCGKEGCASGKTSSGAERCDCCGKETPGLPAGDWCAECKESAKKDRRVSDPYAKTEQDEGIAFADTNYDNRQIAKQRIAALESGTALDRLAARRQRQRGELFRDMSRGVREWTNWKGERVSFWGKGGR